MKKLLITIALALFAAGASAGDIYHGLAKGHPELQEPSVDRSLMQPRDTDAARFQTSAGGTRYPAMPASGQGGRSGDWSRDIYGSFCGGNSDLNC